MPLAKVSITVTKFNVVTWEGEDGLKGTGCEISSPVITDTAGGLVTLDPKDPNTLKVKGTVDIEFDILPAGQYFPYAISFVSGQPGQLTGPDPLGQSTFQDSRPEDNRITVTDTMACSGKPGEVQPRWEFWILIKNAAGAGGIIDPGIENSAED